MEVRSMMPLNLVLVRHGQSEGNVATRASKKDDDSYYTEEFRKRLSAHWRLTDLGRQQAQKSGHWIRNVLGLQFDRYYVSEYIRALETAVHLGLPGPWQLEFYLRERDWANIGTQPLAEVLKLHGDFRDEKEQNPLTFRFGGGESIADTCLRNDRVIATLHRECSDMNVIMVCHGEVIDGYRIRLEHLTSMQYADTIKNKDSRYDIKNGQVVHYTRKDPNTGEITPKYNWVRSVCPHVIGSEVSWQKIERKKYSNEDLDLIISGHPQIIS